MNRDVCWLDRGRWATGCVVALALCTTLTRPAAAAATVRLALPIAQFGLTDSAAAAPGILGHVHRMATRSERTLTRLVTLVTSGLVTWLWVLLSGIVFLVVSAIASAVDLRMFTSQRLNSQALARDLLQGVRIFFRILRDRQPPYMPRLIPALALVYWLLPVDLLGDGIPVVGMLDDVLVAVLAAKLFIYM